MRIFSFSFIVRFLNLLNIISPLKGTHFNIQNMDMKGIVRDMIINNLNNTIFFERIEHTSEFHCYEYKANIKKVEEKLLLKLDNDLNKLKDNNPNKSEDVHDFIGGIGKELLNRLQDKPYIKDYHKKCDRYNKEKSNNSSENSCEKYLDPRLSKVMDDIYYLGDLFKEYSGYPCENRLKINDKIDKIARNYQKRAIKASTIINLNNTCRYISHDRLWSKSIQTIEQLEDSIFVDIENIKNVYQENYRKICLTNRKKRNSNIEIEELVNNDKLNNKCEEVNIVKDMTTKFSSEMFNLNLKELSESEIEIKLILIQSNHENLLRRSLFDHEVTRCHIENIIYTTRGTGLILLFREISFIKINKLLEERKYFNNRCRNLFNQKTLNTTGLLKCEDDPDINKIKEKFIEYIEEHHYHEKGIRSCGDLKYLLLLAEEYVENHLEKGDYKNSSFNCTIGETIYSIPKNQFKLFIRKSSRTWETTYLRDCMRRSPKKQSQSVPIKSCRDLSSYKNYIKNPSNILIFDLDGITDLNVIERESYSWLKQLKVNLTKIDNITSLNERCLFDNQSIPIDAFNTLYYKATQQNIEKKLEDLQVGPYKFYYTISDNEYSACLELMLPTIKLPLDITIKSAMELNTTEDDIFLIELLEYNPEFNSMIGSFNQSSLLTSDSFKNHTDYAKEIRNKFYFFYHDNRIAIHIDILFYSIKDRDISFIKNPLDAIINDNSEKDLIAKGCSSLTLAYIFEAKAKYHYDKYTNLKLKNEEERNITSSVLSKINHCHSYIVDYYKNMNIYYNKSYDFFSKQPAYKSIIISDKEILTMNENVILINSKNTQNKKRNRRSDDRLDTQICEKEPQFYISNLLPEDTYENKHFIKSMLLAKECIISDSQRELTIAYSDQQNPLFKKNFHKSCPGSTTFDFFSKKIAHHGKKCPQYIAQSSIKTKSYSFD